MIRVNKQRGKARNPGTALLSFTEDNSLLEKDIGKKEAILCRLDLTQVGLGVHQINRPKEIHLNGIDTHLWGSKIENKLFIKMNFSKSY